MRKAFLDLDGTLLDSKRRHEVVLQDILNNRKIDIGIEDYLKYKSDGNSTKTYLSNIKKLDDSTADEITKEWVNRIEAEKYLCLDTWYSDAEDFLTILKSYDFRIIVVTARKNKEGLYNFLKSSEQSDFLDDIVIVSPTNASLNKKEYILSNLGEMNIVVGDTEGDCISGTDSIELYLLNRGFRSRDYWDNRNLYSYDNLYQIAEKIKLLFD